MSERYDLLIFGATRNTGLHVAKLAVKRGMNVAAMARSESDTSVLESLGVKILQGDAFSLDDCKNAVNATNPKNIITLMGGKNSSGRRVCAEGNINVAQAVSSPNEINRFILVTSMGCGDQYENSSEQVKKFLGEALRAKTEAENFLRKTDLPWTIIRPGGLTNDAPTGDFGLLDFPDKNRKAYVSREDVAAAIIQVLDDEKQTHRVISVQGGLIAERTN